MKNLARTLLFLSAALAAPCANWDTSGNGMLNGNYYFREVLWVVGDQYGDLGRAISLYGGITFGGNGTYTMTGTDADSAAGRLVNFTVTGTYSIAASGYGFISNPLGSSTTPINIYGLVSSGGVFVGSSSESGVNDIFVAAPQASTQPTSSSFTGTWMCAGFDLSNGTPASAESTLFTMSPDGNGHFNLSGTGYFGTNTTATSQSNTGLSYIFSGGAAVPTFPTSATLIVGQKYLYFSKDGNFMFGGSPTSFDFIVGVKTGSTTPAFSGLYYEAGADEVAGDLDSFYGSFYAINTTTSSGTLLGHERIQDVFYSPATTDYTYSVPGVTVKSDGTFATAAARYVVGTNGIRIGSGIGAYGGFSVAVPAPVPSGTGVFLDPTGIRNAGSWAPFTEGIAPGELLTLTGSGLAAGLSIAGSTPFPQTLGNVQVSIGGLPAPIYYVSAGQISVIVPYAVTGPIVAIQVTYNNVQSNIVTTYLRQTAPGILTRNANGLGDGDILHPDYTLVTPDSPAKAGETVAIYLTGLGAVTPGIKDGDVGPSDTFAVVPAGSITAYIGGKAATVGYAGLAPTLAGLYQINVTIPSGLTAGENTIDITGPDAYSVLATIPIAASSSSASFAAAAVAPVETPAAHRPIRRR